MDLVRLQSNIKKDPESYRDEFVAQQQRFDSMIKLLELQPDKIDDEFVTLVNFLSHTVPYYKEEESGLFATRLFTLMEEKYPTLERNTRKAVLQALILLRNRNRLPPLKLLSLCFVLFRVADKDLRSSVYNYIVNDIQNVNRKQKNDKLNRTLQHKLYGVLEDKSNEMGAKKSLEVVIELYRRHVWRDAKTVNVISTAVFSGVPRMMVSALRFLLGDALENPEDEKDTEDYKVANTAVRELYQSTRYSKKTKARQKQIQKAIVGVRKKGKKVEKEGEIHTESSIILSLNDPQGFTEKLFSLLKKSNHRFDVRLMMMNVISRCINVHELVILNFYPYVQRYLRPHQQEVTNILALLASSCHEFIPDDIIQTMTRVLADNFVNDHSTASAQTVGINAIREICKRCPDAMDPDLLSDLVQYKDSKDKGTTIAARGLIRLFREINPKFLPKSFRGRPAGGAEDSDEEEVVDTGRMAGMMLLEQEQQERKRKTEIREKRKEKKRKMKEEARRKRMEEKGEGEEEEEEEEEDDDSEDDEEEGVWRLEGDSEEEEEGEGEKEGSRKRKREEEDEDEDEEEEGVEFVIDRKGGKDEDEGDDGDDDDSDDDDEEEEEEEGKKKKDENAVPLEACRALTTEEFERLKVLKMKRRMSDAIGEKMREEEEMESSDEEDNGGFLNESEIIGYHSRKRQTKEERLETVKAGREGRGKFGSTKGNHMGASKTNQKKKRNQPFMLSKAGQQRKKKNAPKKKKKKYNK